jgi:hypothetical protein
VYKFGIQIFINQLKGWIFNRNLLSWLLLYNCQFKAFKL